MRRQSKIPDRDPSAPATARRDPLASTLVSTLLIGGPLLVVALVKLVLYAVAGGADPRSAGEAAPALAFLLGFAAVLGPIVAAMRRWMGPERSLNRKNLATGVLVGITYATACTLVFGGGMDLGDKLLLGGATALGIGWAFASGLNEAFAEGPR
jgi:hypothetical protein